MIYNSTGTIIIWEEIYDLDDQARKHTIKSSVLLGHKLKEGKLKYNKERIRKTSQTMQLNRNKMRKTKHKEEKLKKILIK